MEDPGGGVSLYVGALLGKPRGGYFSGDPEGYGE